MILGKVYSYTHTHTHTNTQNRTFSNLFTEMNAKLIKVLNVDQTLLKLSEENISIKKPLA